MVEPIYPGFVFRLGKQYDSFAEFASTALTNKWSTKFTFDQPYSQKAIDAGKHGEEFFLPKGMLAPAALRNSDYCFGVLPSEVTQEEKKAHVSAFYDILHLFWTGYFLFIRSVNKKDDTDLDKFINEAILMIKVPKTSNLKKSKIGINDENKYLVPVAFIGVYALNILMTEDKVISTEARIEAIRLWKKLDPAMKFGTFDRWYNSIDENMDHNPNVLPSSWNSNHSPDKIYTRRMIWENAHMKGIFGDPFIDIDRLPSGLAKLLDCHKESVIQIVEAFLRMDVDCCQTYIVKFFFNLLDLNKRDLERVFGEKATYRNKGIDKRTPDEQVCDYIYRQ